jgi:hypothetical protein
VTEPITDLLTVGNLNEQSKEKSYLVQNSYVLIALDPITKHRNVNHARHAKNVIDAITQASVIIAAITKGKMFC